ncbi:MAG: single-stranded DNA-binding protein [Candidatus Niyogibacteria bacterium CG10_big_fil_rev_8_21_14_0_10_42_19]|uniref:Single-stranded DNA-binding protein n=1 Tax=Candidatus Niyogibacteria bacterium CG10_big_fil_rev_8_21_14_0_10_42_19 TaxID=1974725 RepID=A0A2H0THU3_9BACT|nr:MAG: single-stranded DNA-binding protein [Candidatus Niyogibacteria bacterium CG10_big_fil_rev_8_21_14_0_10_42_19]
MNLNKAFIIGNMTRDPEIRNLPSGQAVANFGIATNRFWNKDGQKQQQAEFHNVVLFGKLAEIAKQYLFKGSMVMIEGRIQTRSWAGQDGQKRWRTEIIGERLQLGPKSGQKTPVESADTPPKEEVESVNYGEEDINPEDIPF